MRSCHGAMQRYSKQAAKQAEKRKKRYTTGALVFATALGLYSVQLYNAATRPCTNPAVRDLAAQKDVSGQYDNTADGFDNEVGISETLMRINNTRKELARKCTGHVLEVSCGTGRNLGYFDIGKKGNVDSLTFVDLSPQMIEVCKKKWDVLFGKKQHKLKPGLVVRFLPGSAVGQMPLAPTDPPRKYDTIIQTMGICSTPTPVELLTNMFQYLDVDNPEARVYLLEHGRSYLDWMNNILDTSAEKHAERHGCWFNRDIGAIVEDAAKQTGMEVVRERRYHFGTTWVFELKPGPDAGKKTSSPVKKVGEQAQEKSRGWFGWNG
ncbi:hypothetical protein M409DRAFT_65939 [Zasmidium cellare ATCC 36951]|uniref:Methyltransferase domain-containing protein n=1 Tax=Zasmidium cellare ATCC 36951 TaxID=1080233 RepID=A0A6A6CKY9_ZASCE|nr:uncharacterized protein M409DRAFT_65939 [Zasmidium cellare ATCC 36951]KAF2167874.1 hypothetical protein M409DRAFT_65939 [Zasmidium cellare ATCC 36951]